MDNILYKETTVRRGHTYRYYFSPPASQQQQPTLLFLHGFPSTAYEWRRQIAFFQPLGYGIVAPDLLGAGGTAKPLDPKEFRLNALADDVLDILAGEGITKVVSVSHDWGSVLAARLSMLYPDICDGFVWMGLGFMDPPTEPFDLATAMVAARAAVGYDAYAYWEFFTRPDAYEAIEKNVDAFLQLLYPERPEEWKTWIVTRGKTAELVDGDIRLGKPSYLSEEEYEALRQNIVSNGIRSSLNWYHAQLQNVHLEDNINIPEERKNVVSPSLVFLALRDIVSVRTITEAFMAKRGTQVEYVEVDAGHWLQVERPDEVNAAMRRWLDASLSTPARSERGRPPPHLPGAVPDPRPNSPSFDAISASGPRTKCRASSSTCSTYYHPRSFDVWRKQTKGPPGFTARHAIGVVNLARLTGEDTLLPVALLTCCGLNEAIVRGCKREDEDCTREQLSLDDIGLCFRANPGGGQADRGRGRDVPARFRLLVEEDRPTVRDEHGGGVLGPHRGRVPAQGAMADLPRRVRVLCSDRGRPGLLLGFEKFRGDVRQQLCKECWAMVQDRDLAERRETWNRLLDSELLGITVDGWGRC
ncbi:hypothetical protein GSI_12324 [Ganoderma sinense ZZ0214-1]|uniref:AB hydrolase-1 domain-containing protein n=1 Tax=Ganoderma sinense ZZ0214-1 TaxID=1077348 RepID=A0A2G8RYH4_9APHY|nr:hypothetical protein GSI_12324 [Ganoderma sinense ZZ0214-1]